MIEAVVKTCDPREGVAQRQRADVGGDQARCAFTRDAEHRERRVDTDRSKATLFEIVDRVAGAAGEIEMRLRARRIFVQNIVEEPSRRGEEMFAERLIVRVREGAVRFTPTASRRSPSLSSARGGRRHARVRCRA